MIGIVFGGVIVWNVWGLVFDWIIFFFEGYDWFGLVFLVIWIVVVWWWIMEVCFIDEVMDVLVLIFWWFNFCDLDDVMWMLMDDFFKLKGDVYKGDIGIIFFIGEGGRGEIGFGRKKWYGEGGRGDIGFFVEREEGDWGVGELCVCGWWEGRFFIFGDIIVLDVIIVENLDFWVNFERLGIYIGMELFLLFFGGNEVGGFLEVLVDVWIEFGVLIVVFEFLMFFCCFIWVRELLLLFKLVEVDWDKLVEILFFLYIEGWFKVFIDFLLDFEVCNIFFLMICLLVLLNLLLFIL